VGKDLGPRKKHHLSVSCISLTSIFSKWQIVESNLKQSISSIIRDIVRSPKSSAIWWNYAKLHPSRPTGSNQRLKVARLNVSQTRSKIAVSLFENLKRLALKNTTLAFTETHFWGKSGTFVTSGRRMTDGNWKGFALSKKHLLLVFIVIR
jgi:hypothetical protein